MVLSTPVPTETIHAIIHELIGDNLSLRNTSLVARSFLRLSQQLLFTKIVLTLDAQDKDVNVARAQRLLSIFSSNPGLALHPREFSLTMNKKWKATHALPQMLAKLTRIQVATLNLETDWETMDLSTQNAISDLCGVHSLIDLTLTSVFGFPAENFAGVSQLKRLNLKEMEFRMSDANHEIPELGISGSRTRGQLEVLEFDNDTACRDTIATLFEALKNPQSRLGIEELRALKINGDGEYTRDSIREVIKFAAESLECFVWDTLDGASEDNGPYYYSLESLPSLDVGPINIACMINVRCLVVSFPLIEEGTDNTTWILYALGKMQANNCLEELILILYLNPMEDTDPDMEEWTSKLDLLLARDGFQSVARVSIFLAAPESKVHEPRSFPDDTEEDIIRHMPILQSSGALTVGHLDTWEAADGIYEDAISRSLKSRKITRI